MSNNQPIVNQLPAGAILLFLPIVVIEMYFAGAEARLWGSFDARLNLIRDYTVVPELVDLSIQANRWSWDWLITFVTYPFVHGAFLQATFGAVFVLAIGKFVGEAMGSLALIIIFFVSAIVGAAMYVLLTADTYPMFGAFPAAYGLIGAFTFVRFAQAEGLRDQQVRAFQLIGILMALSLLFSAFFGGPNTWVGELFGAVTGFLTAAALRPGGVPYLLAKLRRD
ncbi:MAG: rhomboid family intramembrane serine protease [Planktomarina sp.]